LTLKVQYTHSLDLFKLVEVLVFRDHREDSVVQGAGDVDGVSSGGFVFFGQVVGGPEGFVVAVV
jgi:hypothetical protein